MGFTQGLSGLSVYAAALDVDGNNIANVGTVGFKSGRAHFADVFAAALTGAGAGQVGIGASVPSIGQLFTQGNITVTNNALDMAINGEGFYRLDDNGAPVYSRNGQFHVDKQGFIVNTSGLRLSGYGVDANGDIVPGNLGQLRINSESIEPSATTYSNIKLNLDSRADFPGSFTSGAFTGDGAPGLVITGGVNDTFTATVDGIDTLLLTIPANTYANAGALAGAIENLINNDVNMRAADIGVEVTLNNAGAMTVTSESGGVAGSQGRGSTVNIAGSAVATLFGAAPTTSTGADNFDDNNPSSYTSSTAQTVYDSLGIAHNMTLYFVKTAQDNNWLMYTAMDGDVDGVTTVNDATSGVARMTPNPVATVPPANRQISVTINGQQEDVNLASLTAYADLTAMQTDLQNGIDLAFGAGAATVTVDNGDLVITSATTGQGSQVLLDDGATLTLQQAFGVNALTSDPGVPRSTTFTATPQTLSFNSGGELTTSMPLDMSFDPGEGARNPLNFELDLTGSSQYGINFGVNELDQDGYTSGRLTGVSVSPDGVILGRYSNGQSSNQGQVVLVNFNNPDGLLSLGKNVWAETSESGQPIPGAPGEGSLGQIQAAAVEESNVDLTQSLVDMIVHQRYYQANSQTIRTQDQVLQTLVNLR